MDPKLKEIELHKKHEIFALSFPMIFFRTCRGELDYNIMNTLLNLKDDFDNGRVDDEEAKRSVIDGATNHIRLRDLGEVEVPKREKTGNEDVSIIDMTVASEDFI
jgi:hypothetical protein